MGGGQELLKGMKFLFGVIYSVLKLYYGDGRTTLEVYTEWNTLHVIVNKLHIDKAVKKVGLAPYFYTNVEEKGRVDLRILQTQ